MEEKEIRYCTRPECGNILYKKEQVKFCSSKCSAIVFGNKVRGVILRERPVCQNPNCNNLTESIRRKYCSHTCTNLIISQNKETQRKISLANTGRKVSDATKRKLSESNTRRVQSEETKLKISKCNLGKKLSEENKEAMILLCYFTKT